MNARVPHCLIALPFAACAATVAPPAVVTDPVTVFLLREAMHAGLVLPRPGTPGYVEFGFGDFDWYVLGENGVQDVAATVLWPTPATLARREWPVREGASLQQLAWFCELQPVVVDRLAAAHLAARLERQFASAREGPFAHMGSALQFVRCEPGYWLLYNCNEAVAGWLRELGCQVGWVPICTSLRVRLP